MYHIGCWACANARGVSGIETLLCIGVVHDIVQWVHACACTGGTGGTGVPRASCPVRWCRFALGWILDMDTMDASAVDADVATKTSAS